MTEETSFDRAPVDAVVRTLSSFDRQCLNLICDGGVSSDFGLAVRLHTSMANSFCAVERLQQVRLRWTGWSSWRASGLVPIPCGARGSQ